MTVGRDQDPLMYALELTVCSEDGTSYQFTGTFATQPNRPPQPANTLTVSVLGKAVCATDNSAIILDVMSCAQGGGNGGESPAFCTFAIQYYSGRFVYGVSSEALGVMSFSGWGNTLYPIDLVCSSEPLSACQLAVTCNTSTSVTTNVYVQDGFVTNVTNSNVILQENNTAIFEGTEVTITQSNFTIQQGDAVNETNIYTQETVINIEVHESAQYNIITLAPLPCGAWVDWSASRTANVSISSAAWTLLSFTAESAIEQGEVEAWELLDESTLYYVGETVDELAYDLTVCLQEAILYGASEHGLRVLFGAFNVTALLPASLGDNSYTTSVVPYNHTEPSFVGGACASLIVPRISEENKFAIAARLERTDGNAATAILAQLKTSLAIAPVGCSDINTYINITAEFNDTQLIDGVCTTVRTVNDEQIAVDNDGVCSITVENGPISAHTGESWMKAAFHRATGQHDVEATSTLTGNLIFEDSNNVEPRYNGDQKIRWNFKCPIHCENEEITTNSTCRCEEGVETEGNVTADGTCNCEDGVETEGSCSCGESVETPGTCSCGESVETPQIDTPDGEPLIVEDGVETPEITTPDGNPLEVPDGIETPEVTTPDGSPLEVPDGIEVPEVTAPGGGPVSIPGGTETPSVEGPGGLPVAFPTGISPGPPVPITIALNPSGGGGNKGPCQQGGGLLDPKEPIVGIMPDGRRVKLIGSVLSSGASLASSGVSAATSAATGAAGVVAEVVTGVLGCNGGGPPLPSPSLSGLSTPGLPGIPGSNLHASLAAAISALSGVPGGPPPSADSNAAEAVAAATGSTGYLLPSAIVPTEITIWGGGLQIPTFNDSIIVMECGEVYRGHIAILKGPPDEALICLERDDGWDWYPIPFGEAFFSEVFNGNGTGLVVGDYLEMHVYPNGTLYEIRDRDILLPGNCSNCNLQVDATGKILGFSSGTTVITGNHTVLDTAILRASDSAIILDENSTFINAGPTVLNGVTINQLNVTEVYLNGSPLVQGGVTSVSGTPGEIEVSSTTGDIVLSLAEEINFSEATITDNLAIESSATTTFISTAGTPESPVAAEWGSTNSILLPSAGEARFGYIFIKATEIQTGPTGLELQIPLTSIGTSAVIQAAVFRNTSGPAIPIFVANSAIERDDFYPYAPFISIFLWYASTANILANEYFSVWWRAFNVIAPT